MGEKLLQMGVRKMVILHMPEEAVCCTREGSTRKGTYILPEGYIQGTTGAGDAFCAGAAIGLTYGKNLAEACQIGAHLAASVIVTSENVCPRFLPGELGLDVEL